MFADVIPLLRLPRPAREFTYSIPEELAGSITMGSLVSIPWRGSRIEGIVLRLQTQTKFKRVSAIQRLVLGKPVWQQAHFDAMAKHAHEQMISWPTLVHALLPHIPKRATTVSAHQPVWPDTQSSFTLSRPSIDALRIITEAKMPPQAVHVHRMADRHYLYRNWCATTKGQVLILVPQLLDGYELRSFLEKSLNEPVALWGDTPNDSATWGLFQSISEGTYRIVITTRSGALLPLQSLGMVIIDQEDRQDHRSWEAHPRLDGRDLARDLGAAMKIPCRETSFHPRLERVKAVEYAQTPDTPEHVNTLFHAPAAGLIHADIEESMKDVLDAGKHVLLIATKKAAHSSLLCVDCQHRWICPTCASPLQERAATLACPHCAHTQAMPFACPRCGGNRFRGIGAGLETLVERLPKQGFARVIPFTATDEVHALGQNTKPTIIVSTPYTWRRLGMNKTPIGLVVLFHPESLLYTPDYRANEWYRQFIQWHKAMAYSYFQLPLHIQSGLPVDSELHTMAIADSPETLWQSEDSQRLQTHMPPYGHSYVLRLRETTEDPMVLDGLLRQEELGILYGPKINTQKNEAQWLLQTGPDSSIVLDKLDKSVYSKLLIHCDPDIPFFV